MNSKEILKETQRWLDIISSKNLSEEELARRQADYEEKKKAYDAIDPKAGNPVFSKIGSKSHFMQYELMQKEEACEKQYNAVVTEIRDMMK